jgi:hypothetical protein
MLKMLQMLRALEPDLAALGPALALNATCPSPLVLSFFLHRSQVRSVVTGPMLMVRFGTCGALRADVTPGTVVVASMGAVSVA